MTENKKLANHYLLSSFFVSILTRVLGIASIVFVIYACVYGMQQLSKILPVQVSAVLIFVMCAIALIFESYIQGGLIQYDLDLIEDREPTVWTIFSRKDTTFRIAAINVAMLLIDCIIAFAFSLIAPVFSLLKFKYFGYVLELIVTVVFNTSLFLAPYFIIDDKNVRTMDALFQSIDFMNGKKIDLALMYLSYFIEFALSVIFPPLFCYLITVIGISNAMFYLDILNEHKFIRGEEDEESSIGGLNE